MACNALAVSTGHPGSTARLLSAEQLKFQRSVVQPAYLARNSELRGRMIQFLEDQDKHRHAAPKEPEPQTANLAIAASA